MQIKQLFRTERTTRGNTNVFPVQDIDSASWVWMPGETLWGEAAASGYGDGSRTYYPRTPFFRFRNEFTATDEPLEFDISADERFTLYLDGQLLARGPHRGFVSHWYYQSYAITGLTPGRHVFDVVCWQLGVNAPIAQLSWRGGFIMKASGSYDAQLTTGRGNWKVAELTNTTMNGRGNSETFGVGCQCAVKGTGYPSEEPAADAWKAAEVVRGPVEGSMYGGRVCGWMLFPTERPDQVQKIHTPGKIVNASCDLTQPIHVAANSSLELWWDLDEYVCAYPEMTVDGGRGTEITWGWTESLRDGNNRKGNRNEWQGKKYSQIFTDTFICDGRDGAFFTSPWWRCGRWCRITVKTSNDDVTIRRITINETHYPLAYDAVFGSSDASLVPIETICRRTIQMCMHEMMVDCPYYEQQMYPGDTRIQLQILNSLTQDDRMHRFVLSTFDYDRRDNGMTGMNLPTRGTQESATYTMCWILMFRDYLFWHDNAAFLKTRMPGVRNSLMGLELYENSEGLLENLPGWSFMDWVDGKFSNGVAPCGHVGEGVSALNNLLYLMAMKSLIDVETALGEEELAARLQKRTARLSAQLVRIFWDEQRGMMADTAAHDCFSEHAQCLAILTGCLSSEQQKRAFKGLTTADDLAPASTYFAYYLFEAYALCGHSELIMKRLDDWRSFIKWGARTALETQHSSSRSDCHAWSAAPLYFFQTVFAGVSPMEPFFKKVRIAPQPAGLTEINAATPSPKGMIRTELHIQNGTIRGTVTLPAGMDGIFVWKDKSLPLHEGTQSISMN